MDAVTESISVEREVAIAASPETVWQLLVDPEQATRWMGRAPTSTQGADKSLLSVDLCPGSFGPDREASD